MLVLTGNPDAQQASFHDRVPVGGRLRVFGAIPVDVEAKVGKGKEAVPKLAGLTAAELIASGATNYRRWVNFPWAVVERGGQVEAGAWTPADAARLSALTALAHARGLWIRFYTLNGHAAADDRGWTASYNFGIAGRGRDALARRPRCRRRLHRLRSVRRAGARAGAAGGRGAGGLVDADPFDPDQFDDDRRARSRASGPASAAAASRCCRTAGASRRRGSTSRSATSRCR